MILILPNIIQSKMMSNYAIRNNVDLFSYNSFGLKSLAAQVIYPFNVLGVQECYSDFDGKQIVVLGNGTNILFSKEYYDENYVFVSMKLIDSIELVNDSIIAGAGVPLNRLAWFSIERGFEGFEFLEDIPGSVGGAAIMNAGTYSDNISQLIEEITYFDIDMNKVCVASKEDLNFRTRGSDLSDGKKVVTSVKFVRCSRNNDTYLDSLKKVLDIKENRYTKQPRNYPSGGSVFKRPTKDGKQEEVWRLVNDVGLRGFRIGKRSIVGTPLEEQPSEERLSGDYFDFLM